MERLARSSRLVLKLVLDRVHQLVLVIKVCDVVGNRVLMVVKVGRVVSNV